MAEIERQVRFYPINEALKAEGEKLAAEGWTIEAAHAVWHLVREKPQPNMGVGHMVIDDTKVHIIKADGSIQ